MISARHSGAHRSQIDPPSSSSSSPSTAVPTTPYLSAAHPSIPSSASLLDRAGPSNSSDTPPRPNTATSPSQRICHLKKEREADPKEEETDLRWRESTMLLCFCCFAGHDVVADAERKRRRSQSRLPCFPVAFAAARGEDAPPLFLKCQKSSQHYFEFRGVYFVNFKWFNVIFV
jgi:hypothetical protein